MSLAYNETSRTELFQKLKWMLIKVIFLEFVFAHTVVELRTALGDYFKQRVGLNIFNAYAGPYICVDSPGGHWASP